MMAESSQVNNLTRYHLKKRWNRIASSSSEDEVIESSQDSPLVSEQSKKMLLSYNCRRSLALSLPPKKSNDLSDIEDVPEDPVELQPREFGSCPRGAKRMPRLDCIMQSNSLTKTKRRLEMEEVAESMSKKTKFPNNDEQNNLVSDSSDSEQEIHKSTSSKQLVKSPSATIEWDESSEDTTFKSLSEIIKISSPTRILRNRIRYSKNDEQSYLAALIRDGSESEPEAPVGTSTKKFEKTPSTTIEWDESPDESTDDEYTIESVPEAIEVSTPVIFTRILVEQITEYFGLSFIKCTINEESSIVLVRPPKGVKIKKGQILEVHLPENSLKVREDMVYVVDKHRIVRTMPNLQ